VFDESKVQGCEAPNIRGILILEKSGRGRKKGPIRLENRVLLELKGRILEF
jgi:hypothetical protein